MKIQTGLLTCMIIFCGAVYGSSKVYLKVYENKLDCSKYSEKSLKESCQDILKMIEMDLAHVSVEFEGIEYGYTDGGISTGNPLVSFIFIF